MKISIVNTKDLNGRLDPYYYREEFIELEQKIANSNFPIMSFEEKIQSIINGIDCRNYENNGITYLRVGNIKSHGIDLNNAPYINPSEEFSKNVKLKKGDLLLTRKGSFGIAYTLAKDEDYIISSEIFKINLKDINSKYIQYILNSDIGQKQFNKVSIGAIMGSLSQDAVKEIKIPVPPMEVQKQIVEIMDKAYKEKKDNEAEANRLLNSIDDYVLKELGITIPEQEPKKIFTVISKDIKDSRIDVEFNKPYYQKLTKALSSGMYKLSPIYQIVDLTANDIYSIEDNTTYKYLDITSINKDKNIITSFTEDIKENLPTSSKKLLQTNDIVISKVRPYLKNIAIFTEKEDSYIATGALCILRSIDVNPNYLFAFMRLNIISQYLMRFATGSTYPTVKDEDIINLSIPMPSKDIQDKIANEVKYKTETALHLQTKANECIEQAKKEVEKIIFNNKDEKVVAPV